jgi:methylmalonyl-CoA mutase cobalamin-binding domain/chain
MDKVIQALVNLSVEKIGALVEEELNAGRDPMEVLGLLRAGMEEVGKKYEVGEYFLADLIMAGETMKEAMRVLMPHISAGGGGLRGKIVLGTVAGDVHDIGKNTVATLLTSAGFDVHDLGIDVPPENFAETAKEVGAEVVGVSSLLSTSVLLTADVVEALKKAGIRNETKVIIGGAAARTRYEKEFGVDAAVNDAVKGCDIIKSWVGERQ